MSPDADAMQNVCPSTKVTRSGERRIDAAGRRVSQGDDSSFIYERSATDDEQTIR
jgi:hypothetical protein